MALQFPTYQPNDVLGNLLSGYQTGMDMRTRYEDVKRARQAEAAQQEIAKAAIMAGRQRNIINSDDQQLHPSPNMLLRALQGLGMSVTPLDVNQPTPQQQPYQAMPQTMPQAQQIPTQASAMATARQLPLAQTPADQFTPAATQPAPDQSAATLATGMTKRGSLPAMSDYIFGRPSTTGPNPVLNVIQTKDGRTVLLPSRINGKRLDINQARAYYKKTGQHLGEFESPEAAMKYAYSLATNTLEPEPQPMQPEAISGATPAPASEISPAPVAEQAGMEMRPDQTQPTPAPQPPAQPSARSFLDLGKQYGLTDDIMRKYPVQALQYIQGRQAQEQSQTKASFDQTKDAITAIESGKTPRDRAAIAQQYASMGVISPAMAQSLATKPSADVSGVQVVPIDKYSEMIRYTDPDTGETKTSIRSTSDKENPSQWISQLYDNDPKVASIARGKLDEYNRMQQQKIQFGVNVRTSAQEAKDAREMAKATAGMGEGISDPDVMNFVLYNKYPPGMGKQAVEVRSAIKSSAMKWMKDNNISPARLAQIRYQYKITEAGGRALENQRQKIESFTNNARRNLDMIDNMVKTQPNTAVPVINRWIRAGYKSIAGDPEVARFDALIQATSNEIAKITSSATGAGVTSDAARKEIERSFHPGMSPAQIRGVVKLYRQELNNRSAGYQQTMNENQNIIAGLMGGQAAPSSRPAAQTAATRRPTPTTKPASGRRVLSSAEVKKIKFL